jgi:hypothetical protein
MVRSITIAAASYLVGCFSALIEERLHESSYFAIADAPESKIRRFSGWVNGLLPYWS